MEKTFRMGPIRPPSEAQSLLLQITRGCTWNKCKFCDLYRHTTFKAYTIDSIKADIDVMASYGEMIKRHRTEEGWDIQAMEGEMRSLDNEAGNCYYMMAQWLINGGENVFLQDGNSVVIKGGKLSDILIYLRRVFPGIKRITSYGRGESLSKVSKEDWLELKAAGLDRIHSGYESGSDQVLEAINKGVTREQEIKAGKNIKAAGIELSLYFMPGIGGRNLTKENPLGMAEVLDEVSPDFVRIRTAAVKPGTELYDDMKEGKFVLCSDDEKVREIRTLVEKTVKADSILVSDHIVNLLQRVEGSLKKEKEKMFDVIDSYFALPEDERKLYQLARRMARVTETEQMRRLSTEDAEYMRGICGAIKNPKEWDTKMNEMISRYI